MKVTLHRQLALVAQRRSLADTVLITPMDSSGTRLHKARIPSKIGKFKVPLLKSPSHFGHYTSRVNRMYNEDKYSANVLTINNKKVFGFGVFDGHGGEQCSTFLQDHLNTEIEAGDALVSDEAARDDLIKKYWKNIGGYWKRWFKHRNDNFVSMNNRSGQIQLQNVEIKDDMHLRLPLTFLKTDYDFFESPDNASGSTCTTAFIETIYSGPNFEPVYEDYYFNRNTISKLTIGHVGDTKAIIVDRTGEAHALTEPHHPANPIEATRLRKYAANFFMTDSFGEERFISLANTRAFGDLDFKQMGVTAEPDVLQFIIGDYDTIHDKLTPGEIKDHTVGGIGGDEGFLILCTDGVYNELTDQEIADTVMSHFNMKGHPAATPQKCAEEVIKFVEYIGGDDNATCLVIRLNGWGKWQVRDRTGSLRQQRMDDFSPRDHRQ